MSREQKPTFMTPSLMLNSIIANPAFVFWVRDLEGRYATVSRGYGHLMGVAAEDCIGKTAAEFMPPELAAHADEVCRRIIERGEPTTTDETHVIQGSQRHFTVHRVPIRDADGKVVGILGFSNENTSRALFLRETEAMNRVLALFSSAANRESYAQGLVDIVVDVTGCRVAGIRAIEAGLANGERLGDTGPYAAPFLAQRGLPDDLVAASRAPGFLASDCLCAAVVRRDGRAVAPAALDEQGCLLVADTRSLGTEMDPASPVARLISKGFGTIAILPLRHQEEVLGCIVLGDPEPGHMTPATKDFLHRLVPIVSEAMYRFAVERRLENSRLLLRSVVHTFPVPVWIVDPRHRVVFRNETHIRHFVQAAEGAACHQVLRGRNEPCPECDFPETLMGISTRREWHDSRTDRTYDIIAVPYETLSGERQRIEVFFEVTERVRVEAQLRQTQRLDSLGSLAAGIAHDFNNILAGIIGYSQLGLQRSDPESDCAQVFEQIGQIAERGAELTRKILAFSRRQTLKVSALDINAHIIGMRTILAPLVGDRIELVLDLADGLWAVQGDGTQIEQVLLNLCVNAVESMPGGGWLTIRTRNVEGEALRRARASTASPSQIGSAHPEPAHGIVIEVSDTGHGMPPEVVSQAVEPFFTTKGRGRGTGLGLSVSYGIVQQHHGNMLIESAVGCGTTVRVYLPAMGVTPSRVSRPAHAQAARGRPGLPHRGPALVVEDDPPIRELVAKLLAELEIETHTAASGSEALEVLASEESGIRLVITDVAMPGMSGLELARRIRESHPEVQILFMSGCSDSTLEQYGLSGDHVLLRKPFTLQDLITGIETTASRQW